MVTLTFPCDSVHLYSIEFHVKKGIYNISKHMNLYRGSYMTAHVLLNLLKRVGGKYDARLC